MSVGRGTVLTGLLAALAAVATLVLFDVLGTVFLAVTVAYLLAPLHDRVVEAGVPDPWASVGTALAAAGAALVPIGVGGFLVYRRREELLGLLDGVPTEIVLQVADFQYVVDTGVLRGDVEAWLSSAAVTTAAALPSLVLKFSLFVIVLFALLVRRHDAADALLSVVPTAYHDVAHALHHRTRATLFTIYVLQAVSALGTFLAALPTFVLLGYPSVVTLAVIAGVLQFLPIVGPSVLVVAMTAYELTLGDVGAAIAVFVLGSVVVAWLPDTVIRLRLSNESAGLPGSLYFIGFVGGLLTMGVVGIVAGPLAVALLAEGVDLVAAENGSAGDAEWL